MENFSNMYKKLIANWLEEEKNAHIIEWEFPNFSVNNCLENLFKAQEILEKQGVVKGNIHHFLIVAQK